MQSFGREEVLINIFSKKIQKPFDQAINKGCIAGFMVFLINILFFY